MLCPSGLFVVNEDGGLDKAEEWTPLPDREMGAAANWVHRCIGSWVGNQEARRRN